MPYDGISHKYSKLLNLADILDDKDRWPAGFKWHYAFCDTCAMGLAYELGKVASPSIKGMVAGGFAPDFPTACDLFSGTHPSFGISKALYSDNIVEHLVAMGGIGPEHVSAAIRDWVSSQP